VTLAGLGELRLHRDKLPVDDVLLVLYHADQGSESDEKLRLLASMAQTRRGFSAAMVAWLPVAWGGTTGPFLMTDFEFDLHTRSMLPGELGTCRFINSKLI
jgi:hypothetical protein